MSWYMLFPNTHAMADPWWLRGPLSFVVPSSVPSIYDPACDGTHGPSWLRPVPEWDASAYLRLLLPVNSCRPTAVPMFLVLRVWQVRAPLLVCRTIASFLDASEGDGYSLRLVRAESDPTVVRFSLDNWVTLDFWATSADSVLATDVR